VSGRHVLRRGDGSVLDETGFAPLPTQADGTPAGTLTIPLEGAAPGRYDLSLEVRDDVSGQTRSSQESWIVDAADTGSTP
jgi:hypothetical protein